MELIPALSQNVKLRLIRGSVRRRACLDCLDILFGSWSDADCVKFYRTNSVYQVLPGIRRNLLSQRRLWGEQTVCFDGQAKQQAVALQSEIVGYSWLSHKLRKTFLPGESKFISARFGRRRLSASYTSGLFVASTRNRVLSAAYWIPINSQQSVSIGGDTWTSDWLSEQFKSSWLLLLVGRVNMMFFKVKVVDGNKTGNATCFNVRFFWALVVFFQLVKPSSFYRDFDWKKLLVNLVKQF